MKNDSSKIKIEKTFRHENPFVSQERMNAGIFKELDNYHRTLKLSKKLQRVIFFVNNFSSNFKNRVIQQLIQKHHFWSWVHKKVQENFSVIILENGVKVLQVVVKKLGHAVWTNSIILKYNFIFASTNKWKGCTKIPVKPVRWDMKPMFPL